MASSPTFVLDSELAEVGLDIDTFTPFDAAQKALTLRIFGRNADGKAAAHECPIDEGLHVKFYYRGPSTVASTRVLLEGLIDHCQKYQREGMARAINTASWSRAPLFRHGRLDATGNPLQMDILTLTFHHLSAYKLLRRLMKETNGAEREGALTPWHAHLVPVEYSLTEVAAPMARRGIRFGEWFQPPYNPQILPFLPVSEDWRRRLPALPNLLLASYDIECCSELREDGKYAFPDATKSDHQVRCIALTTKRLHTSNSPETTHRYFLHTYAHELKLDQIAAVADSKEEDAPEVAAAVRAGRVHVKQCRSEADLLLAFSKLLRDLQPDLLYGYNSLRFDAAFLAGRLKLVIPQPKCERPFRQRPAGERRPYQSREDEEDEEMMRLVWQEYYNSMRWGRTLGAVMPPRPPRMLSEEEREQMRKARAAGKVVYEPTVFVSPGLAQQDVLEYGKSLNLDTAKLNDVAAHVLGYNKVDLEPQDLLAIMASDELSDSRGWLKVAVYNLRDADLPLDIMLKRKQVEFTLQLVKVANCALPAICAGGQQKRLLGMIAEEVQRRGLVFNEPTRAEFADWAALCGGGEKVKGATVLDVATGYYRDPVVTCDYNSLYPSILISRNLCPSTLFFGEEQAQLTKRYHSSELKNVRCFRVEELDDAIVEHYHVRQLDPQTGKGEGVYPAIARKLLAERKEAKRQMKQYEEGSQEYDVFDAQQCALKVICNSLYGCLNAVDMGSLYCRPLGGIITAEGRRAIRAIQEQVETIPDSKVVAGDTDSVMFLLRGRSIAEAQEIGEHVAASVTSKLHADGAHAMTLGFEKVMLPSCFVAKKAYSYLCYKSANAKPTTVSMGLLSKKRGTCDVLKNAFISCERCYLLDPTIYTEEQVRAAQLSCLFDMVRSLWAATPFDFSKTALLRPEASYAPTQKLAHVCAARRLVADTGCAWPADERVRFVQLQPPETMKKSEYKSSDWTIILSQFDPSNHTLDFHHYVENVANRFTSLLTFTIPDIAERLGELCKQLKSNPTGKIGIGSFFGKQRETCSLDALPVLPSPTTTTFDWISRLEAEKDLGKGLKPHLKVFTPTWRPPQTTKASTSTLVPRSIMAIHFMQSFQACDLDNKVEVVPLAKTALTLRDTKSEELARDKELAEAVDAVCASAVGKEVEAEMAAVKANEVEKVVLEKRDKRARASEAMANGEDGDKKMKKKKKTSKAGVTVGSVNFFMKFVVRK